MVPEVMVFDLGKVLVDFDFSIAARQIAARGALSAEEVRVIIQESPVILRYESGQTTRAQFFEEVRRLTGFRGDLEEFGRIFPDIFTPIEPMIALHAQWRKQRRPCYVFSNTNDLAIGHIRRHYPFFADFDGYVLSYEQGLLKPDPRFYAVVEGRAGKAGRQILFIDDRPENAAAGRARGWQVIQHRTPEETWAEARRLGVVP
jgi:FMN phosphatase YigB (HAD superfamily)